MSPTNELLRCRPQCPIHGVQLLVGRTVGAVQYRYCTVPGCRESVRTRRELNPKRHSELFRRSHNDE